MLTGRERKTAPGSGPRSRTSIILTCIHNIYIYTRHVTRFSTYISCLIEFPDDPLDPDPWIQRVHIHHTIRDKMSQIHLTMVSFILKSPQVRWTLVSLHLILTSQNTLGLLYYSVTRLSTSAFYILDSPLSIGYNISAFDVQYTYCRSTVLHVYIQYNVTRTKYELSPHTKITN